MAENYEQIWCQYSFVIVFEILLFLLRELVSVCGNSTSCLIMFLLKDMHCFFRKATPCK